MRTILTRASLITAMLSTLMGPGLAHAQWEVRPAPASWGLPQTTATPASQQAQTSSQSVRASSMASSTTMSQAVTCSAALQLATMAAPNWARERGITGMTNVWLQKVFALSEPQGITGDKVPALVEEEMQRQIDGAANDPSILSRRAFDCASQQP
jgi:hypothetical protein